MNDRQTGVRRTSEVHIQNSFLNSLSKTRLAARHPRRSHERTLTMPNYLLLLHSEPDIFKEASPDEIQGIIQKYHSWKLRMQNAGVLVGGEKLQDGTGRLMRRTNGQTSVIDGPYTESKEVIGGLFQIRPDNYDKAVEAASDCPHLEYGTIEIREIQPVSAAAGGD